MYLEKTLIAKIRAGCSLGFDLTPDNIPTDFAIFADYDAPYPPPGYLPFSSLEVGNGDTYGFYWPIGKEGCSPLVATTLHDNHMVFPMASCFERAIKLIHACGLAEGEVEEVAEAFEIDLSGVPRIDGDESVFFFHKSASALLEIDDASPSILLSVARTALSKRDFATAEKYVIRATQILPEYYDAWALLAELRQQKHDRTGFIEAALRAISSPLSFAANDRIKLLAAIQDLPSSAAADRKDPIWKRRKSLTFTSNYYQSRDIEHLIKAGDEFHAAGQYLRVVQIVLLIGDLMGYQDRFLISEYLAGNTSAFQDRSYLPWQALRPGLRQAYIDANLTARLVTLEKDPEPDSKTHAAGRATAGNYFFPAPASKLG